MHKDTTIPFMNPAFRDELSEPVRAHSESSAPDSGVHSLLVPTRCRNGDQNRTPSPVDAVARICPQLRRRETKRARVY